MSGSIEGNVTLTLFILQGALRGIGAVRRSEGRHLPLGQAPRWRRRAEALPAGARGAGGGVPEGIRRTPL